MSYFRNASVLISGTSLSQLILVVSSPILARIYTPHDFAVLAIFAGFVQILGILATGRYELAIVLPERHDEAFEIGVLSLVIAFLISITIFFITFFFRDQIAVHLNMPSISPWLMLVAFAVFFSAAFKSALSFNVRLGAYNSISLANIYRSLSRTVTQVLLGFLGFTAGGLIVGSTLSHVLGIQRLSRASIVSLGTSFSFSAKSLLNQAHRYRQFPLYSLPAGIVNVLNTNILNFALPVLVSSTSLGFYALAMSVLGAPLMQISGPISQIFMRDAAEEIRQSGVARRSFLNNLKYLVAASIVIFGALYFTVEPLFEFVFGENWATAGRYAQILVPLFAVRFVVSPLSGIATLTNNRLTLFINLLMLLVSGVFLWISAVFSWGDTAILNAFAWSMSGCYLIYLPVLYFLACGKFKGVGNG